jgi:adenylate kinase family enzyme
MDTPDWFVVDEAPNIPSDAPKTPETNPEWFAQEPPQPDIAPDSYLGRVGSGLQKRIDAVGESTKAYLNNEITYPEAVLSSFGNAFGALFDTVGETAMSILSTLTPDEAEEWLKEQIAAGAGSVMKTKTAQDLLKAYKGLSPRVRDNIANSVNVGFGIAPLKSTVGKALTKSGMDAKKSTLSKYVLSQTPNAKQARIAEKGLERPMQTVLNREDAILNTVLSIKGISESTSRPKIMSALNGEVARLSSGITKALKDVPTLVPKGAVNQRISTRMTEFVKNNPEFIGKDLKPTYEKVVRAYQTALNKYNGKPQELLQLRRDFDKVVEKFFKKDVHAGDDVSREVVSQIRNELNQIMQDIAPNDQIKAAMQRQHHALMAKENLGYNMAREGSTVDKMLTKIEHHPMFTTSLLTGSGIASKAMGSEALGVGLGTLGAGYALSRPAVRTGAGAVLENAPVGRSMIMDMAGQQEQP